MLAMTRCTLWGNIGFDGGALHNTGNGSVELTPVHLEWQCQHVGRRRGHLQRLWHHDAESLHGVRQYFDFVRRRRHQQQQDAGEEQHHLRQHRAQRRRGRGQLLVFWGVAAFVFREEANAIQFLTSDNGATESGPDAIVQAPALDALADNGGPTRTMALQGTSPARNASVDSTINSDQRGRPIQGAAADIGAYEMQRGTFVVTISGFPGCLVMRPMALPQRP